MLLPGLARAQQCIDSNFVNPYYQGCPHDVYEPVCACGITYFNQCEAELIYGVSRWSWTGGVCGDFDFHFYPNLFVQGPMQFVRFFIQFRQSTNNTATLLLADNVGNLRDRRTITLPGQADAFQYYLPPGLLPGLYYAVVYTGTEVRIRKMVVASLR